MQYEKMLQLIGERLPLVRQSLGDRWPEFKKGVHEAHRETKQGNVNKGRTILRSLICNVDCLKDLVSDRECTLARGAMRGVTPSIVQMPTKKKESILAQHIMDRFDLIQEKMEELEQASRRK
jgi:hypothetical protein